MRRQEYLDKLLQQYEIEKELSRKDSSCMFLLRHKELGKELVVRSTARRIPIGDFLKTIVFRYLPEVYDTLHLADGDIILEEALHGRTLDKVLEERTLSYREARDVLSCVADALTVIHRAGYVHRDIKPKNIMITDDGDVKLIDFDASRAVGGTDDTVRLGTAGFAAPEQYVGASDRRADVFALGVLLNVMLTGRHPSVVLPKNYRARKIVCKATAMNPEMRFSSAEEFQKAL